MCLFSWESFRKFQALLEIPPEMSPRDIQENIPRTPSKFVSWIASERPHVIPPELFHTIYVN